jgi:hypothetical protein
MEGNARIKKVLSMRPGFAKIFQTVRTSRYFGIRKLSIISQKVLAVLITLTRGGGNKFIDCHKSNVRIAVLLIMEVETHSAYMLGLLKGAYQLRDL